jgi:hypothetical protein
LGADIEMCDCYEEQEAELAGRFKFCNAQTDPVEKKICLEEVNALLDQMKEENCHEQPNCWENAQSIYEEIIAICDALDDDSADKEQCYERAQQKFDAMNEECCVEDAHAVHKEKAEACEGLEDPNEREACHAEVKESLNKNLEECRP